MAALDFSATGDFENQALRIHYAKKKYGAFHSRNAPYFHIQIYSAKELHIFLGLALGEV